MGSHPLVRYKYIVRRGLFRYSHKAFTRSAQPVITSKETPYNTGHNILRQSSTLKELSDILDINKRTCMPDWRRVPEIEKSV